MEKEMSFEEMPANLEISFSVGREQIRAFLIKGFFDFSAIPSPYHHHHYTELHLLAEGEGTYLFSGREIRLKARELLAIPAGTFHETTAFSPGTRHIALQTTLAVSSVQKIRIRHSYTQLLLDEIERYCRSPERSGLQGALGLLFSVFFEGSDVARPIRDAAFLIDDYFDHHYHQEPRLEELAALLKLSAKQTARLVLRSTGHTFRAEITRRRMEAARQLMKDQSLSLSQIAEKVGYQSYSGFWKAYHENGETKRTPSA